MKGVTEDMSPFMMCPYVIARAGPEDAWSLRCQTPTTHTKNITSNFSQARSTLPDDGSQTIRNMSEWFLIVFLIVF